MLLRRLHIITLFALVISIFLSLFEFGSQAKADQSSIKNENIIQIHLDKINKPVQAVADELLIKYKEDVNAFKRREFKTEHDLQTERLRRNALKKEDIEQVGLQREMNLQEFQKILEQLEDHPAVEYVEPNYVIGIQSMTPNDAGEDRDRLLTEKSLDADLNRGLPGPNFHTADTAYFQKGKQWLAVSLVYPDQNEKDKMETSFLEFLNSLDFLQKL